MRSMFVYLFSCRNDDDDNDCARNSSVYTLLAMCSYKCCLGSLFVLIKRKRESFDHRLVM
jgi:hypothetical protein